MAGSTGPRTGGRLLLAARSVTFAVVSVGLAGIAHVLAGGAAPAPIAVAVAVAVLTQLTMLLGPRERGWLPIAALLLVSQLALHPVLIAFPAHPHSAAAHQLLHAGGSLQMGWAHVAAVLATAWWLRRGEARAAQLASGALAATAGPIATALAMFDRHPVPAPLMVVVGLAAEREAHVNGDPGRSVRRRGPPVALVASPG